MKIVDTGIPPQPVDILGCGRFNLTKNIAKIFTNELLIGNPWQAIRFSLYGEILGDGTNGTGTVREDAPLNLFGISLNSTYDEDIILQSPLRPFFRLSQYKMRQVSKITAPTLTTGSGVTTFAAEVIIPFWDLMTKIPDDTILHTIRNQGMTLTLTVGDIADIIISPTHMSLQNLRVDITIEEYDKSYSLSHIPEVMHFWQTFPTITPPGTVEFNLPVQTPNLSLKRLFIHVADTGVISGSPFTGTGIDGYIDTVILKDNVRFYVGATSGGIKESALIDQMTIRGELGTNRKAGTYVIDMAAHGSNAGVIPIGDKSFMKLIFALTSLSVTTPQISVMGEYLKQLKPMPVTA